MQLNYNHKLIIERLTALWALNECGLGGFMHAFSSPFTGIIVGGISVLLISLIAYHAQHIRKSLLKALIIVLFVKLSVSPHSPITAYLAVSFQALFGIGLYSLFSVNRYTIVILGMLTFLESALQKLLTLTIIYGQSFWEAIDVYTLWISSKIDFINLSISAKHLMIIYVSFYAISGIVVGILITKIMRLMQQVEISQLDAISLKHKSVASKRKPNNSKTKLLLFWSLTLVIILFPLLIFKKDIGGWETGIYLIARSFLIITLWYIVFGPLLMKGLNKFLSKRKSKYKLDIQQTLLLLPHLRGIVNYAWHDSSSYKGLNRMQHFLAKSIVFSVYFNPSKS